MVSLTYLNNCLFKSHITKQAIITCLIERFYGGYMRKLLLGIIFLFLPILIFASANIRNISAVGNCYTAGQILTVNFEVNLIYYSQ